MLMPKKKQVAPRATIHTPSPGEAPGDTRRASPLATAPQAERVIVAAATVLIEWLARDAECAESSCCRSQVAVADVEQHPSQGELQPD